MNAAASKRLLAILLTSVLSCAAVTPTAAEPVYRAIEIEVEPAKSAELLVTMIDAAKEARAFDGCNPFANRASKNNPERKLFCEIRESKQHHQAYQSWREETRFEGTVVPLHGGRLVTNSLHRVRLPKFDH
jgi:quinol monooxygenase YgiN